MEGERMIICDEVTSFRRDKLHETDGGLKRLWSVDSTSNFEVTYVLISSTGSTEQPIGLCDLDLLLIDVRIGWFQVIVESLSISSHVTTTQCRLTLVIFPPE